MHGRALAEATAVGFNLKPSQILAFGKLDGKLNHLSAAGVGTKRVGQAPLPLLLSWAQSQHLGRLMLSFVVPSPALEGLTHSPWRWSPRN